uniref:protein O-GlcNAc transferase n=1 Tax=Phytophthora ramorum TaxID=164328 RepID=H3HC89_PHYRM
MRVLLALFVSIWSFFHPIQAATVLVVTPENEASLTLAADLYHAAQEAAQVQDKERLFRESIEAYPEIAAAKAEALKLLERGLQTAEATQDEENIANIRNNFGFIARSNGKFSVVYSLEALEHFDAALEINPDFVGALYNKASVLLALRRDMEAKELFLKVLELDPDAREAHMDLGRIYFEHGELEKALEHEDRVIQLATTTEQKLDGLHNKGVFLKEYNLIARALEVYDEMLELEPVKSYVLVDVMNAKRSFCDWRGMEKLENQVLAAAQQQLAFEVPEDPVVLLPFDSTLLKISDVFRKRLAMRASKQYEQPSTLELLPLPWSENDVKWDRPLTPQRLKIGYLSFDYRDHPMGHLTLGIIEQHAVLAQGVDTICYSYGPNSAASAPWRRQFEDNCGVFRDLLGMSDLEAAQTIGRDGIDILVDLMAHTKGARLGISSLRPSRIAVNYLGYPGTMGSNFTDFAMVDRKVLPPEVAAASMSEQVVYLPHTYQANRYEAAIASVLWLLAPSGGDAPRVMEQLHEQAMAHAADALWANVPIVTFWGGTFPSRVAASLIQSAMPFPELVSHSVKDYERVAVYLAKTPKRTADAFSNAEAVNARVNDAIQQGISLQEAGEYLGAQNVYSRVLRASPGNADAIHLLGTLYFQTEHFERAAEHILRAIAANPHVSWYHSNLGLTYVALEKPERADPEFQLALQLDASNRVAISKLSEIYTTQKSFDMVVDLYATYGEAAYFSGGQTSVSQDEIEKAYVAYSDALSKTGRSLEAIQLLEDAVQQHPGMVQLSYNLGVMYNEQGRYDEGNQQQFATVVAQGRHLYDIQGQYFAKIPRPEHKVVIAFYCHEYEQAWWAQWGPSSLNTGLGGSEEAVVFLSRELQKLGYWVEIYGDPSPQDVSTPDQADEDTVRWYPHYAYDIEDRGVDIFVAWRYHISMAMGKAARKKYLWMHDLPQEDAKQSPELLHNADGIFCLSDLHTSAFPESLQSKITVITNAVDPSFFVNGPNHADRFVYGSAPTRGLYTLLRVWPRIRESIPSAELSVFYGFRPAFIKWGNANMVNFTEWMTEMNRLLTETPGVRYVGLVDHAQLAKEYSYAGFYLYPTTFSETSCISLMKAMANGAVPITSRFPASALPETVGEYDLGPRALQQNSVEDDPEWLELWIRSIVDAVRDEQQALTVRHRMKRFARKKYRWEHIALQWHRVISKPRFP